MSVPDLREVLVYLEQGQPGEAIPMLERLTRERPAHVTVHLLLARAYEQVGRVQSARVLWQATHFLMPNSPVVREGLRRVESPAPAPTAPPSDEAPATEAPSAKAPAEQDEAVSRAAEQAAGVPAPAEEHAPAAPDLPEAEPPHAGLEPAEEPAAAAPDARPEDEPPASAERRPERPMTTDDLLASLQHQRSPSASPSDENDDDLQRLIDELEAARIEPSPDLDAIPPPELDNDIEDMVSETLARIYVAQGQHRDAAKVYLQLARQHPERAGEFEERADELRRQATETENDE